MKRPDTTNDTGPHAHAEGTPDTPAPGATTPASRSTPGVLARIDAGHPPLILALAYLAASYLAALYHCMGWLSLVSTVVVLALFLTGYPRLATTLGLAAVASCVIAAAAPIALLFLFLLVRGGIGHP